jgi:hypothetical protein
MSDITQRKAAEDKIKRLAFYDPLTQLPNRRLLLDRLQMALEVCQHHQKPGPCCSSTWTTSKPSTTPWATTRATACCRKWHCG